MAQHCERRTSDSGAMLGMERQGLPCRLEIGPGFHSGKYSEKSSSTGLADRVRAGFFISGKCSGVEGSPPTPRDALTGASLLEKNALQHLEPQGLRG